MFRIKERINKFDRVMMAITFAEAGEREMALDVMNRRPKARRKGLGLRRRIDRRPVLRA